ncbi:hypothetical protein A464_856 [Salmonella bongori N268-08]|uniref:Uncharacterized protein n=1 Tax=Salmonella bongori N268-08 TaxID=1197719 RepID=S5NCR6_SALBN|nr:hypothetical protein A464_856 [Salmonella bongori N268-08]
MKFLTLSGIVEKLILLDGIFIKVPYFHFYEKRSLLLMP